MQLDNEDEPKIFYLFLIFKLANDMYDMYPLVLFISLTGNKLTLETRPSKDGIDIRQELLKFHSTYYSSNLMGLCVLGRGKNSTFTYVMLKCCKILRWH